MVSQCSHFLLLVIFFFPLQKVLPFFFFFCRNVYWLVCRFIWGENKTTFWRIFGWKLVLTYSYVSLMRNMRECLQVWSQKTHNSTLQHYSDCYAEQFWVCESSTKSLLFYLAWSKKHKCPDTGHIQIQHPDQSINMPSQHSSSNSLSWQQPYWHKVGNDERRMWGGGGAVGQSLRTYG